MVSIAPHLFGVDAPQHESRVALPPEADQITVELEHLFILQSKAARMTSSFSNSHPSFSVPCLWLYISD